MASLDSQGIIPWLTESWLRGRPGLQGGAVARHLLKLGKFEVRCLTRRPDSEAAKAFKQLGADMVKADLDDPASLKLALRGCTGVFGRHQLLGSFSAGISAGCKPH
jgi:uncharacterized protein YbjT (DUF2867 family)